MSAAPSFDALGALYLKDRNFLLAERTFRLSLLQVEQRVHPMHSALVLPLGCLGWAIASQSRYDEAEKILLRALVIAGKARSAATRGHDLALEGLIFIYERQTRHADKAQMLDALERLRGTAFQVSFRAE
jgi:hypothetical protein